jgi:hypothetical protein
MPRKKKSLRVYEPPEIVGNVDALPPVQRHNKGESMYDEAIVHATENKGKDRIGFGGSADSAERELRVSAVRRGDRRCGNHD